MAFGVGRRELIAGLGSVPLAWPHAVGAQKPAIPVVGYLSGTSPDDSIDILADFRRGWPKPAMSRAGTWRSNAAG